MTTQRTVGFMLLATVLGLASAGAAAGADGDGSTRTSSPRWDLGLAASTYFVPDDSDFVSPLVTADRGRLHLEGRYNYEDKNTGSLWVGMNFAIGDTVAFELTPMLGGVFGDTTGIAPGYRASLAWWWFDLYSEGEWLYDTDDSDDSFFYAWSELGVSPVDWLRFGLVGQRTRLYQAERDIQRGFLLGFTIRALSLTGYVFDPDEDDPLYVLTLAVAF